VSELEQLARRGFRVGVGSRLDEFVQVESPLSIISPLSTSRCISRACPAQLELAFGGLERLSAGHLPGDRSPAGIVVEVEIHARPAVGKPHLKAAGLRHALVLDDADAGHAP
jgi:hypothetical protein